ncbi:phage portal protein [Parasphingorhabdus sp.]|uniref:phage portal protein n=1 Tax=Parasphingorhabdus sp. TaxID=2709688 RepID=UPI003001DBC3
MVRWTLRSSLFGRGLSRPAARDLLQRRFDAASGQRGNAAFGSYGPETLAGSALIARKARHATENNAWMASGVSAWTTALIGAGIMPTPQHPDRELRPVLQSAFNGWAADCDMDGLTDFYGLQSAVARSMIVSGEAFLQLDC